MPKGECFKSIVHTVYAAQHRWQKGGDDYTSQSSLVTAKLQGKKGISTAKPKSSVGYSLFRASQKDASDLLNKELYGNSGVLVGLGTTRAVTAGNNTRKSPC